jgi:hypothetical protein
VYWLQSLTIGIQALSSYFISGRRCHRNVLNIERIELLKHGSALLIAKLRASHSRTCLMSHGRMIKSKQKRPSESLAGITRKSIVQSVPSRNLDGILANPSERVKKGHVRNVVLRHAACIVILNDHREKDIICEDNCLWLIAVPLRPRDPQTLLSIRV